MYQSNVVYICLVLTVETHVSQAHRAGLKLFHQFLNKMNCHIFYFLEIWATKSMLKGTNQSEFGSLLIQISTSVSGPKVLKNMSLCDLPLLNFSENSPAFELYLSRRTQKVIQMLRFKSCETLYNSFNVKLLGIVW